MKFIKAAIVALGLMIPAQAQSAETLTFSFDCQRGISFSELTEVMIKNGYEFHDEFTNSDRGGDFYIFTKGGEWNIFVVFKTIDGVETACQIDGKTNKGTL